MPSRTDLWFRPIASLWQREILRFVRQRSRLVGALATPIVFWFVIGSGLRRSVRLAPESGAADYLQYAFPGTIALIVLFTAIFSTISIIEDRREGFLQAVLASPVKRSAIVLGKVFGCSTLAVAQGGLFLLLAPLVGVELSATSVASVVGVLVVLSIGISGLGVAMAWPMESTQGFHAVMNLFLMPMWLLSGAFFPAEGASNWVQWVMTLNPLTYGVAALRRAMFTSQCALGGGVPSWEVSLTVVVAAAVILPVVATGMVSRSDGGTA